MDAPEAFSSIRLVCPRCRRLDPQGRLLIAGLRDDSTHREARLGALDAARALECESATCRARYPVIGGIPIVFAHPDACTLDQAAWFGPSAPPVETLLAAIAGRDPGSPLAQDVARVARWVKAGFGDWAEPATPSHVRDVMRWMDDMGRPSEGVLGSFGCAVGREAWETSTPAVLVDAHLPSLLVARELGLHGRISTLLPGGNHLWQTVEVVAPHPPRAPVALVCADALDPPFEAQAFSTLLPLNLIDSVSDPWLCLQQLAAATRETGWLTITSPFAWRAEVTPRERWLRSLMPLTDQQALLSLAAELHLEQIADREMHWSLWVSERESVAYRSACLVFRRE